MNQFLRFVWNDALAFLAVSAVLAGVLVVLFPRAVASPMPSSYGYWIIVPSGAALAYRVAKAACLLRFGVHVDADILDKYVGFRNVAKINYSFDIETRTGDQLTPRARDNQALPLCY